MVNVINNIIEDKQDIKNQLGTVPDVIPSVKRFSSSFKPKRHSVKINKATIGSGSFVLNSSLYGVLGTDTLGRGGHTDELYAVVPENNTFNEYFQEEQYINTTNSTGTLNTDTNYALNSLEVLESEIIAKLRQPINKVKLLSPTNLNLIASIPETNMVLGSLELGITVFNGANTDGDVLLEMTVDGTNWEQITDTNTDFTFDGDSNDELKYRFTAINAVDIEPITIKVN